MWDRLSQLIAMVRKLAREQGGDATFNLMSPDEFMLQTRGAVLAMAHVGLPLGDRQQWGCYVIDGSWDAQLFSHICTWDDLVKSNPGLQRPTERINRGSDFLDVDEDDVVRVGRRLDLSWSNPRSEEDVSREARKIFDGLVEFLSSADQAEKLLTGQDQY